MAAKKVLPNAYGRLVGYARVSTEDQNLYMQTLALKKAGVMDDNLHVEKLSATSKNRPELEAALQDLREGDTFVVWRLDRLARNLRDLHVRLDKIVAKKCKFRSLTENFDIDTAIGKLYVNVLGAVAEFERQLTAERTKHGIAAYKERTGKEWGPEKKMTETVIRQISKRLNEGAKGPAVAREFDVSTGSVYGHFKKRGKRWVRKDK